MAITLAHQFTSPRHQRVGWTSYRECADSLIKSVQLTVERLVRASYDWMIRVVDDFKRHFDSKNRQRRKHQLQLTAFDDRYEEMVDLICSAAQSNNAGSREVRYKELRGWMHDNYGAVRVDLNRCWKETRGNDLRDPLEALISYESLQDLVMAGSSIENMILCRHALDTCQRTLRSTASW